MKLNKICGESMGICSDQKIDRINLELAEDKNKTPIIIFQDWTGSKQKNILTLHIKEAIALKSLIDSLVFDYHNEKLENVGVSKK